MSLRGSRPIVCLALVVLIVVAGCSGAGNSSDSGAEMSHDAANVEKSQASSSDGAGTKAGAGGGAEAAVAAGALTIQSRQLIRTGTVRVRVDSYDKTASGLRETAESMDGFVSDSRQRIHGEGNRSWTSGRIVFRIPKAKFDAFVSRAKRSGEVQTVETNTEDVTDKLVDIEARLENLRAERDRLRELYQRANETSAILDVQERLSDVQGEIERLEAKRVSLEERVAYSTVTVEIEEQPPERTRPERQQWYEVGVVAAFLDSVGGVVVVLRALVVGTAYSAPYLLAFGVPVVALAVIGRRWRAA